MYFDGADAAAVLHEWAAWGVRLPETINTSIAVQRLPSLPGVPEPLVGRMTVAVHADPVDPLPINEDQALLSALPAGRPWSTGGQMANFAPSDDPARPLRVYNDDARYWLAALAERYDPALVLATGQVVR